MASFDVLAVILSLLGLSASVLYYSLTIQNQNRTRHAQLLSGLYETYRNPDFRHIQNKILDLDYSSYEDFNEKYRTGDQRTWSEWQSVASFFNGLGVLLKNGMIDIVLVEELFSNITFVTWVQMEPIISEWRKGDERFSGYVRSQKYEFYSGFEYLYNELVKRDK